MKAVYSPITGYICNECWSLFQDPFEYWRHMVNHLKEKEMTCREENMCYQCIATEKKQAKDEGMKFDDDKLRFDLIPPEASEELAKILTMGAKKYAPNNWQKIKKDRYLSALYRHLNAWQKGEINDGESGERHLSHALCNVVFLLWKEIHNVE